MSADPARAALDRAVLDWIAEGVDAPPDEARFSEIALALFRHQHATNAAYRRICALFGLDAAGVRSLEDWREIPPVPTGAFKQARLACFPPERAVVVFRSSGSTTERRGALHLDTLELYRASALATFGAHLCPDLARGERIRLFVLAPSAEQAPDSSLSRMFAFALEAFGNERSGFHATPRGWHPDAVIEALARVDEPVLLAGTAFAFVHLIDALAAAGRSLSLPAGSRAMETGGFKGRSRELSRDALHAAIALRLGLGTDRIVNQYGMCELASQFYEDTLRSGYASQTKRVPPWCRTRVVDAETLADLPPGTSGALLHYDLANTGSVLAVLTSDEGREVEGGFEVQGRIAGAEARGCSIAADALLSGAQ